MPNIGMSVPGASSLTDQVGAETDEERRKRLAKLQAARQLPVGGASLAQGYGAAFGTQ